MTTTTYYDLNIVEGEDSIGEHKFELRDIEKGDD